jgi:molecular chaperone HscA
MVHLLQLVEPGQTSSSHDEKKGIAVGIDLGTTNSLVAVPNLGVLKIGHSYDGRIPSVVSYHKDGGVTVGKRDCSRCIRSIKRLMGRNSGELDPQEGCFFPFSPHTQDRIIRLTVDENRTVTPIEVSAEILKHLKSEAENTIGEAVSQAVITVPAHFDDAARAATRDAARLAGLEVLRLINEPTAAALAYGLDNSVEGVYAIYDLGGGTFDISLLKLQKGVFQVLATGGDTQLGGDDIDRLILKNYFNNNPQCIEQARAVKEELTEVEVVAVEGAVISRDNLRSLMAPLLNRTTEICASVLDDANCTLGDIKGIVLVGGATRMMQVVDCVRDYFGQEPLANIDPDQAVALGAAAQAGALTQGSDNLLLDVTPMSLGLEMMGGIVEKIIDRNTPIPVSKTQEFTTFKDGQTGLLIHVLQGERETVDHCRSLARFELSNIPPMVSGAARIAVTFTVDADGLLTVEAREESTGNHSEVHVKPTYGLSDEEMEAMLRAAHEHAQEDMEKRLLSEACVEAERTLDMVRQAIVKDEQLLNQNERLKIENLMKNLEESIASSNRHDINQLCEDLVKSTDNFAQRRIHETIETARGDRARH